MVRVWIVWYIFACTDGSEVQWVAGDVACTLRVQACLYAAFALT